MSKEKGEIGMRSDEREERGARREKTRVRREREKRGDMRR